MAGFRADFGREQPDEAGFRCWTDPAGTVIGASLATEKGDGSPFSTTPFSVDFTTDSLAVNFLGRRSGEEEADLDQELLGEWRTYGYLFADITLETSALPIPPAVGLFASGLLGRIGISRRMQTG